MAARSMRARPKTATRPSTPDSSSPSFEENYLDIDSWPHRWCVEPRDLLPGQRMLDIFKPFLFALLDQGLARKTLRVHRDHVCDLGSEIIRRLNLQPHLRRQSVTRLLKESVDEDGGPLIYPRRSEADQRSFDTTCRKLHRFLIGSESAPR